MLKYLTILFIMVMPVGLLAEEIDGYEVAPHRVIVKYHDKLPSTFEDPNKSVGDIIRELKTDPKVEYVEPDYIVYAEALPNDPMFTDGTLWGMNDTLSPDADINVVPAWDVTTGSPSVYVGVIDTGVDYTHPDLAANIWSAPTDFTVNMGGTSVTCPAGTHGFNAITNTCDPMDDHYHGTHVSGTIGGVGNNGVGVVGVNWDVSIIGCKFLSSTGSGSSSNAVKCLDLYEQLKAIFGLDIVVTSNSWGGGGFLQSLLDGINTSGTHGTLFAAAAGNAASDTDISPHYPSSYDSPYVVSVASHTNSNLLSSFSNWGLTTVDLSAPGSSIMSTRPANTYGFLSGTSMATPHVSGALALMASVCAHDPLLLRQELFDSVTPESYLATKVSTGGRLNVANAISTCMGAPLPSPTPAPTPTPVPMCSLAISGPGTPLRPGYAKDYSISVTSDVPLVLTANTVPGLTVSVIGTTLRVADVDAAPGNYTITVTGHNASLPDDCTASVVVKVQKSRGK